MFPGTCLLLVCVGYLGGIRNDGTISETVDLIELNHFYDQQGKHTYDQVIFYERNPANGVYRVRAWCLVEDRESLNRRPTHDVETGFYNVRWLDTEQNVIRCIKSKIFRESWSHVDPERIDKKKLDERYRLSLVQPSKRRRSAEDRMVKEASPDSEIAAAYAAEALLDPSQALAQKSSK